MLARTARNLVIAIALIFGSLGMAAASTQTGSQTTTPVADAARAADNRGFALMSQDKYDDAIVAFREAIRLDPNDAKAYEGMSISYGELKQYRRSIQNYDHAIRLDPGNEDSHLGRGLAYSALGQYQRAIQDYDQAIRLKPSDAAAYDFRSSTYAKLRQYKRALQDLNEAIRLDPVTRPDFYTHRAGVREKIGDRAGAKADRAKAHSLGGAS